MSFGEAFLASIITMLLGAGMVACWFTGVSAVASEGGGLVPSVTIYAVTTLLCVGALAVIVKVWRP